MWRRKPKVDKEAITNQLVSLGFDKQEVLSAIETVSTANEKFNIHQVAVEILDVKQQEAKQDGLDDAASSQLAPYFYSDECPDHHFDFHALPWILSSENHKALQFGRKFNDIAIHSELLAIQSEGGDAAQTHSENKLFVIEFISHMLTHQCPRFDIGTLDVLQQHAYGEETEWDSFLSGTRSFVDALLYTKDTNDCLKQVVIYQYPPSNEQGDETDIHGFELQKTINRLVHVQKDKEFFELCSRFKVANEENELSQLRRLLNRCQGIETETKSEQPTKSPLFVHHLYPKHVLFAKELKQLLKQKLYGLFVPQEVISTIVEFAITVSNEMYFDSWYLPRNAGQSKHKLVSLWNDLLFDEKMYTLTKSNAFNGSIQNTWIPSPYLLKNTDNSLQKIANELEANNVLHIYRQIIWAILLHVNPLNARFDHNVSNIISLGSKWNKSVMILYKHVLKWKEWQKISIHSSTEETFLTTMMNVFGGNIFNAMYGVNRIILIREYDINGGMFYPYNWEFVRSLDARMDEIYPLIIPVRYQMVKTVLESMQEDERPPSIWSIFNPGLFDPMLKCYLIELMFLHGIDALVLTFAAYLTLASSELAEVYSTFASTDDLNMARMEAISKSLYSFNDVKSLARLYAKYRDEITSKHSAKITLKQNPLIMDVGYRAPPPGVPAKNAKTEK